MSPNNELPRRVDRSVEVPFKKQLVIGLATLVAFVVAMAITAIMTLRSTTATSADVARDYADGFSHVQRLYLLEERLVASARGYLLSGEPALRARFEQARADLEATISDLSHRHLVPAARQDLEEVDQASKQYLGAMAQVVEQRSHARDPEQVIPIFDQRLAPMRARMATAVDALSDAEHAVFENALVSTKVRANVGELAVGVASVLTILCSVALALLVGRRLTRQFRQVENATIAAQRAADAREEILAIVSHDLRSPLQAIATCAELVSESPHPDLTRKYGQTIHNASDRMRRMVDELLEAAQLEHDQVELHTEPLDAADLLDTTDDLFRERAKSSGIELRMDAPHVRVLADRERVVEVLSNLLGNAFKFTQPGGHIAVRVEPGTKLVRFTVEDDGAGIPPDQLPHVFERGWQGTRKRLKGSGLGLGLYICKRLVEAHHGTIGASSEVGHGARFWFMLQMDSRAPS